MSCITALDVPLFRLRILQMFRIAATTAILAAGLLAGCSTTPKAPAVADNVRKSLEVAGLKDVSVTQDRDKGVVTLGGHVATDADKANANQIAQSLAAGQVVANQLAVLPATDAGTAKTVNADLDKGIENNLDAALISGGYQKGIHHSVKNGVVTLTGTVDTASQRAQLETLAQGVPNTLQVVDEIQTLHQKATSSN
jgi:hyperosmotically inducible periplasmic protein